MVFCASHFLPLVLLVPFPSAAPILVVLYLASLYLTVRPCVYCSAMITFVLLSTSYHPLFPLPAPMPSSEALPSALPSTVVPSFALNTSLPVEYLAHPALPDPSRGWVDINSGRILDPVWVGFKHREDVVRTEAAQLEVARREEERARSAAAEDAAAAAAQEQTAAGSRAGSLGVFAHRAWSAFVSRFSPPPKAVPSPSLPPRPTSVHARDPSLPRWDSVRKRLDLRLNGVGPVLDFGFGKGKDDVREAVRRQALGRLKSGGETG